MLQFATLQTMCNKLETDIQCTVNFEFCMIIMSNKVVFIYLLSYDNFSDFMATILN